ncbi:MAG: oligosaccharide flippase family protein [Blautia hansenii]
MGKKNDNTLVKNASFLMVAALISKIIGLIYKSPLSSTMGKESFGCFQFAQNVYFILLMIASFSIPQAVSKIMAERLAFKRYRDAQKIFKGALLYAVVVGGAVAIVCVAGAPILVPERMANARLALQFLAPTIFLSGILGVFRGYFQAYRNMLPTSISQIVEQTAVAVVALVMANFMVHHFADAPENTLRSWSAAGATMGTGAGVLTALLFMLFVYQVNRRGIQKKIAKDRVSVDESYRAVMKTLILIMAPILLSAFLYNVNGYINSMIYTTISGLKGMKSSVVEGLYAECGFFLTIINIPLTLSSTAPTSMMPEVSAAYARGDILTVKEKINKATWLSMFISIPCSVGLFALAGPVTKLLFSTTDGTAGRLMMLGVITVIMNGMSNISNGVLQGIGKANLPMIHAAIALGVDVVVMTVLMFATNLGIYTVVIAMIVYALVMCVLNDRSMKKELGYENPWKEAYLPPFLASVPMGLAAFLSYQGLHAVLKSNFLALLPAIVLGAGIYFVVYLAAAKPDAETLAGVPGGVVLAKISRKLHLVK